MEQKGITQRRVIVLTCTRTLCWCPESRKLIELNCSDETYKHREVPDIGKAPKLYGTIKTHKTDFHIRPDDNVWISTQ